MEGIEGVERKSKRTRPPRGAARRTIQKFLEERLTVSGAQGMTQEQKDQLFGQFQNWLTSQTR